MKFKINNENDRIVVSSILIKNGYTVRIVKNKLSSGKYEYFVEIVDC